MLVLVLILFLGFYIEVNAQSSIDSELSWFTSSSVGIQMSGIKSEDFVQSNYSPSFDISVGKWFSPKLALQFGYRGRYFNTIGDKVKHPYNYFFGNVIFDIKEIIFRQENSIYNLLVHAGSGYFYNFTYGQPNICASLAFSNNLQLSENLLLKLDISAIMGWDIYQGDEDILPGLSIGVSYLF